METEELLRKCEEFANQFRKECEPIIRSAGFYCSEIFGEFIGNIMRMHRYYEECKKFFEEAKKETDKTKMMELLGKARVSCRISLGSADKILESLIDLERYLCVVTGIEGYKRKIESDKKVVNGMLNKIEEEINKVWKK